MKILEYELKLLKDREAEQNAKMSSMDQFFSDGVAINNNILALKTMFQSERDKGQRQESNLREQVDELKIKNDASQIESANMKEDIAQMDQDFAMMER